MNGGRCSETSVNELLKEGHVESPMSVIVKVGNQFNGYVSDFTHNQKIQNKSNLCVYFKTELLHFQSQGT